MHAMTGCDPESYTFGKGKINTINLLFKLDLNLQQLCNVDADEKDIAGTAFMCQLYGGMQSNDFNDQSYQIFSKKKEPTQISSTNKCCCCKPCQKSLTSYTYKSGV